MFLWRASPRLMVLSIIAGVGTAVATLGLLALLGRFMSSPTSQASAIVYFALCVSMLVTRLASQQLLVRSSSAAVVALRLQLGRSILRTSLRRLEELGPARLLAALTEDTLLVAQTLPMVSMLLINGVLIAACLAYLAWLSLDVLLWGLVFLVLGVLVYLIPASRAAGLFRRAEMCKNWLHDHLRALVGGIKQLKIHAGRRRQLDADVVETAAALRQHTWSGLLYFSLAGHWGSLLFLVAIGLVLFGAPGEDLASAPVRAGTAVTLLYLFAPLGDVLITLPQLARASVVIESVERLGMDLRPWAERTAHDFGAGERPVWPPRWQRLELCGVGYEHRDGDRSFVLAPLDLVLRPGEILFVVGGNGSGKSTLAKLLCGLYVPERGEIVLDGAPITDASRPWYREHFSAVLADDHPLDRLYGATGDDVGARAAAGIARVQLDGVVHLDGLRWSTTRLSQGQRKRLALVSVLVEPRPLVLLDEVAAEQDPDFKEVFYRSLLPELRAQGRTVVVITHDDRYFAVADRVIKLVDGRAEPLSAA